MAFNNDNNNTTSATGAHKPTIGEKISGTVDSLVGKVTKNPAKVAEGEAKKSGDPVHGAAAGVGQATHGTSGLTDNTHSHTGTGLTGNNHSHTGTGLTGNNHSHTATGLTGNNHSHTGPGLTGTHDHSHTGTGTGLTGSHHSGPGVGDRIAGEKDQLVGRATNNPAQYAQGEARAGEYGNTGTGYGASTGTGLTGSHHNTGTGLTGSHSTGTGLTGNHGHSHGTGLTGNHDSTVLGATGTHTGTGHSGLTGGNHGSGLTGNNYDNSSSGVGRNAGYEHGQPTAGDKISGGLDTLVGKVTSNPAKVAEGEAKRTGDPAHAQYAAANTGTDSYGNRQTGPGAGGFDGNPNTRI